MSFKQFLTESNVARINALKKQQELIDAGFTIKVHKLPGEAYELDYGDEWSWVCIPDGRVERHTIDKTSILTDAYHAYCYAKHVLKGRFPAGEATLATDANHAYKYALEVLKGPFPAGEKEIATDAYHAYLYAKYILKAPFPAGEKEIARSTHYAYYYALEVLNGAFPAGEKAIMSSARWHSKYKKFLASI